MKKTTLANRLQEILETRNLKQVDILDMAQVYCEKYNVQLKRNDLSQYVSGKVVPRQKKLTVLALTLGVNEDWLLGYDTPMKSDDNLIKVNFVKVPLLGSIACGVPLDAIESRGEYVSLPIDIAENIDFALKCHGDSMINASIKDGDIVYISAQSVVNNSDIAAVRIDQESATLKRVFMYEDKIVLKAENENYKPLEFLKEDMNRVEIIGKAVSFLSRIK